MTQIPPRDYPSSTTSTLTTEDLDSVTLCSVKERLMAQQPVSNEMIDKAVTNLFSVDSYDTFSQPRSQEPTPQPPLIEWLKKPSK